MSCNLPTPTSLDWNDMLGTPICSQNWNRFNWPIILFVGPDNVLTDMYTSSQCTVNRRLLTHCDNVTWICCNCYIVIYLVNEISSYHLQYIMRWFWCEDFTRSRDQWGRCAKTTKWGIIVSCSSYEFIYTPLRALFGKGYTRWINLARPHRCSFTVVAWLFIIHLNRAGFLLYCDKCNMIMHPTREWLFLSHDNCYIQIILNSEWLWWNYHNSNVRIY